MLCISLSITITNVLFTNAISHSLVITSLHREVRCTCLHNHTASLGGAVGQPCAGSCADSSGSWTAGSCCAFCCGWWGWSFGWILYRTLCTRVVSHLRDGVGQDKMFQSWVWAFNRIAYTVVFSHLCVWRCASSCLTSDGTFCRSTGRGRAACPSGWGGVWTGWTSAWTLFHTPCSQSYAPETHTHTHGH